MRDQGEGSPRNRAPALGRAVVMVLAVALVVALTRALLVQSFVVPSSSMDPTLRPGDRILVSRLPAWAGQVRRGDVVVFDGAGVFDSGTAPRSSLVGAGRDLARLLGVPENEHTYVKRLIGLPGDRVACCDAAGRITVNGSPLVEDYLDGGQEPSSTGFDVVVPAGRIWVMGDNRRASSDSRAHLGDPGGGTVPLDRIVGRAVAVYWPWDRVGSLPTVRPEENQ